MVSSFIPRKPRTQPQGSPGNPRFEAAAAAAKLLQSCLTLCDPCPWDSPGKNTRVGCHFLLQCMKVKSEREVTQSCPPSSDPMDCSLPGSSVHGIFQARFEATIMQIHPSLTQVQGIDCCPWTLPVNPEDCLPVSGYPPLFHAGPPKPFQANCFACTII